MTAAQVVISVPDFVVQDVTESVLEAAAVAQHLYDDQQWVDSAYADYTLTGLFVCVHNRHVSIDLVFGPLDHNRTVDWQLVVFGALLGTLYVLELVHNVAVPFAAVVSVKVVFVADLLFHNSVAALYHSSFLVVYMPFFVDLVVDIQPYVVGNCVESKKNKKSEKVRS